MNEGNQHLYICCPTLMAHKFHAIPTYSNLWDSCVKYLLDTLFSLQRRAIRIIANEKVTQFDLLQLIRNVASLFTTGSVRKNFLPHFHVPISFSH